MLLRAALLGLAIGLSPMSTHPADAAGSIADEPGAIVLPDAPLLQAVAADMDGDGSRELVRLVRGDDDAALIEVFALAPQGWEAVAAPVEVLPASRSGPRIDPVYAGVPLRLLVHRVGLVERVVVASQPRFDEIDSGPPCCLVLHDVLLEGGELRRVAVSQPTDPVDGILAIDLDGDGTDELLTARSLPPLGGISFPTDARVYRWADGAFGAPTQTELPVGSGDNPILIGDSDGRPGDEAAFISTLGAPGLYRIVLGPGDSLSVDAFGAHATSARGVPTAEGRGIAVVVNDEVSVHEWPAFGQPGPANATETVPGGEIMGVVEITGRARLLVHQRTSSALHVLRLPDLSGLSGRTVARSPAAGALSGLPISSYVGPLPGGGPNGAEAVLFGGRFLPAPGVEPPLPFMGAAVSATLAGAEPVGLVGERDWLAILHSPHGTTRIAPTGGRFDAPLAHADAWLSIAPMDAVMAPEADDGLLQPEVSGAIALGSPESLATGPSGFVAEVIAPSGSRVLATDIDPSLVSAPHEVPPAGRLSVKVVPPAAVTPNPRYRTALIVVTPAGHAYVAAWNVQVLTEPPPLEASVSTQLGSSDVTVRGETALYASVQVDGRAATLSEDGAFAARVPLPPWPTEVEVVATDFLGNTTRTVVSGVGIFDYRGLPWIPIVALLLAVVGVLLFLRQPRPVADPRPRDGDAVLEEMEPD
ncbi:MAG: hypothetical protein ACXWWO_00670 [Candidatus Limnocylindria bacterium]